MSKPSISSFHSNCPSKIVAWTWAGLLLLAFSSSIQAQWPWEERPTGTRASLRGLHAIDDQIAWACGSQSTVLSTDDGGRSWIKHSIPSLGDKVELRSIHAWDLQHAIVATAGQPAAIFETTDRGGTWRQVYSNSSPQAFIDGMKFWDDSHGMAFSDPIDDRLLVLMTHDGGRSWSPVLEESVPRIEVGEAGFAASNSSLCVASSKLAWIGLGGGKEGASRVFRTDDQGSRWTSHLVPSIQRGAAAGIFSIAFADESLGIAVGGDYQRDADSAKEGNPGPLDNNVAITRDGGRTWTQVTGSGPRGYRSCVVFVDSKHMRRWIACGPRGCDWSETGEDWTALSDMGFHTLSVGRDGSVWAAGSEGRAAMMKQP